MQQLGKKSSKIVMRTLAFLMAFALVLGSLAVNPASADAAKKKKPKVSKVSITKPATKNLVLKKGKTYALKTSVKVKPNKKANKAVTYKSSKKKVVSVTKKGKLKALKKGKAKITVTSKFNKKKKANITVTVGTPIKKLKLNKSKLTLDINKSKTLKVSYTPKKPSIKKVTWKSSKKKTATVTKKGKVTGKAAGTATITATAADGSGKKAKCKVTVNDKKDDLKLYLLEDFSSYNVGYEWPRSTMKNTKPAGSTKMTVIADPEDASNKVLEVKPAGYNSVPVKEVKLPDGMTLRDFKAVYMQVRVLEGTDLANKAAVAFFDKKGAISDKDTRFMTYDPNTVQGLKDKTAEQAKDGAKTEWADYTDEQLATLAYNNRFFNEVPMASREDDASTDINERFMPSYSETRAKENKPQEDGFQKGWKTFLLPFELKNIPDEILGLNEFEVAVGANYNDDKVGTEEECVWYLNCIYLQENDNVAPVTSITVTSNDDRVKVGATLDMEAKVLPEDAKNKSVVWTSSDTSVATVDSKTGKVTGVKVGKADIIATSVSNPEVSGKKNIEVFTAGPALEDYVVDLSKVVASGDLREAEGANYEFKNGVLNINFLKQYGSIFIDLGKDTDLNGFIDYKITAETRGQLGFELFTAEGVADKATNSEYHLSHKYEKYPFYQGSMTNRKASGGNDDDPIFGKETMTTALTGDLAKIRYIRINANQPEALNDTVKIHEIRFVAPKEVKKPFPVSTLPISESFESTPYSIMGLSGATVVTEGAQSGSKSLLVKGSNNGPSIVIDNRNGTETVTYDVSAYVKGTTESIGHKVTFMGGSNYANSEKYINGDAFDRVGATFGSTGTVTLTSEWQQITARVPILAGKVVEIVLVNDEGTEATAWPDYYLDTYEAKEFIKEDTEWEPVRPIELVNSTLEDYNDEVGGLVYEGTFTAYNDLVKLKIPSDIKMDSYTRMVMEIEYYKGDDKVETIADAYSNDICYQILNGDSAAIFQQFNKVTPIKYTETLTDAIKTADYSTGIPEVLVQVKNTAVTKVIIKSIRFLNDDPEEIVELVSKSLDDYDYASGGLMYEGTFTSYQDLIKLKIPADIQMDWYDKLVFEIEYYKGDTKVETIADDYSNDICYQILNGDNPAIFQQWNKVKPIKYTEILTDAVTTADYSTGIPEVLVQVKNTAVTKVIIKSVRFVQKHPLSTVELVSTSIDDYDDDSMGLLYEGTFTSYQDLIKLKIPADIQMDWYDKLVFEIEYYKGDTKVETITDEYSNDICYQILNGDSPAIFQQWNKVTPITYSETLTDAIKTADYSTGIPEVLIQVKNTAVTKVVIKSVRFQIK